MKARLWVLVSVLVIGLLASGLYFGWRQARIGQRIEGIFISRISAVLQAQLTVEDFHLGLGYMQLHGAMVVDDRRGLALAVDQVRLSFSLLDHIAGGFRSTAGLKEILLSRPRLSVDMDRLSMAQRGDSAAALSFGRVLPDRITIVDGALFLVRAGDDRRSELTDLDGCLEMVADRSGNFRCTGCWGGHGNKNLSLEGTFEEFFEIFSLRAQVGGAHLAAVLGPALPARYSFESGLLRCSLAVDKSSQNSDPRIQGQLEVSADHLLDGKLGLRLEELTARAHLEGMDVVVENIEARAQEGEVRLEGRIDQILRPVCQLRVEVRDMKTASLLAAILKRPQKDMPQGAFNVEGALEGCGKDLTFQGQLSASHLMVWNQRLADLRARLKVRDSQISVEGLEARLPWAALFFQGNLDLAAKPAVVEADWRLQDVDLAEAAKNLDLAKISGVGDLTGRLEGPADSLCLNGRLRLARLESRWLPVNELDGQFSYQGKQLSYRMESPDGRVIFRGAGMGLSPNALHQAVLQLRDVSLGELLQAQGIGGGGATLSGLWMFSGSLVRAQVAVMMEMEELFGVKGRFDGRGEFFRQQDGGWCLESEMVSRGWNIVGTPQVLRVRFSLNEQLLILRELSLNDRLRISGAMETTGRQSLTGQVDFSRIDAQWLARILFPALANGGVGGTISGRLNLAGTVSLPEIAGQVSWNQGRLADLDALSLRLPVAMSKGTLKLGPAFLSRENRQLLVFKGKIDAGGDLSLQAWGDDIQGQDLSRAFHLPSQEVDGNVSVQGRIGGTTRSPIFRGQIHWVGGKLKMFNFDELSVCLKGEGGAIEVEQLSMRSGKRRLSARGLLPYAWLGISKAASLDDECDLSVHLEGDVLSLLPSFTTLVQEASGEGEASFRLGGTTGSLVLGSGRLRFRGGRMRLAVFIEELQDFDGWMEIDTERHFLEIKELTASVAGRWVEVSNYETLAFDDRPLEPLRIPGLGIHLGILGLRTKGEGIEANIPGLMSRGETGEIHLSGQEPLEPLLLAGPLESPEILGTLRLNHLDFTYPPSSSSEDVKLEFLSWINWNLRVIAGKDLWYENDFASLRVAEARSQLYFTGSAQDGKLRVLGHMEADRGEVTYLDRQFELVNLDLEFDGHTSLSLRGYDNRPLISGRFGTTVYAESTGVATDIWLTIYALDRETGERAPRGRWGNHKLDLSSSDPADDTQEKVLAKLGYAGDYADKALHLLQVTLGPKLEDHFIRPVLVPVERTLKRALGIDVFRFHTGLARNVLIQDERLPVIDRSISRRLFFPHSSLLIGKYLSDNCLLSYLGQFRTRTDEFFDDRLGICHRFGLEYRLRGSTILDVEYDYQRDLTEGDKEVKVTSDKRIQITHRFPF